MRLGLDGHRERRGVGAEEMYSTSKGENLMEVVALHIDSLVCQGWFDMVKLELFDDFGSEHGRGWIVRLW